jgi:quercetin dioxygenase-like cupin family protein
VPNHQATVLNQKIYEQSRHCFPLHSHESFCVGAITKGTALFTINNNKRLLKESMAFIIPSNTGISIIADSEYNYITICFKNELKRRVENIKSNFLPSPVTGT